MNDSSNHGYLLPNDVDAQRLVALLGGAGACAFEPAVPFSLGFYDSFDWRLYAAGLSLFQLGSSHGTVLRLDNKNDTWHAERLPTGTTIRAVWAEDPRMRPKYLHCLHTGKALGLKYFGRNRAHCR